MINEREFRWVDGIRPKLRVVNNLWKMVGQGDSRSGPTGFASNSRCPVFSSSFPPGWFIDTDCSKCRPKILYVRARNITIQNCESERYDRRYLSIQSRWQFPWILWIQQDYQKYIIQCHLHHTIICLKKYYTRYYFDPFFYVQVLNEKSNILSLPIFFFSSYHRWTNKNILLIRHPHLKID